MSPLEEQIKDMARGLNIELEKEELRLIADQVITKEEYEQIIQMIENIIFTIRDNKEGN